MLSRRHLLILLLGASGLALAAPHFELNVYFQSTLTDPSYQQRAFTRVQKAWKAPKAKPQPGKKAVVQAVIARDGSLSSAVLSYESGEKAWDEAALAAVQKAAPFAPLPSGFAPESLQVHFHFTWAAR